MRKTLAALATAATATTLLTACGAMSSSPEQVVTEYMLAQAKGDISQACSLTVAEDSPPEAPTPTSPEECAYLGALQAAVAPSHSSKDVKVKVTGATIDGNEAFVSDDQVLIDDEPLRTQDSDPDPIRLVKSGRGWLVADDG